MTPIHMSNSAVSTPRKHALLEREPDAREAKRPKVDSPTDAAHYLDTLSKVWLTKQALQELERRTRQVRLHRVRTQDRQRRPFTRGLRRALHSKHCSRSTSASEFLKDCSPERLKDVQLFARHGGPDLLDIRGHPQPAQQPSRYTMSSQQSSRRRKRGTRDSETADTPMSTVITKSRSSGAYDRNFMQRMIDNGIYPDNYEFLDGSRTPEPENLEALEQMLAERRQSLSPSICMQEKYKAFRGADSKVSGETGALRTVLPLFQGTGPGKFTDGDLPFNNLEKLMTGKPHSTKPDVYYGARPEQLPKGARTELSHFIEPSTTRTRPMAPNFFIEGKGPNGSAAVLRNQICFNGAVGARAMHKLQTYGDEVPAYDGNAYTLSSTYHYGQLRMYAHHVGQSDGTNPEYYMTQLRAYAMTSDRGTFRKGLTAFRNAEQWTEAQRNAAIEHTRAVYNTQHHEVDEGDEDVEEAEEVQEVRKEQEVRGGQELEEAEFEEFEEFEGFEDEDDVLSSFTSHSSYPVGYHRSRNVLSALRESSPDELALDGPPPRKKADRGWQHRSKKSR